MRATRTGFTSTQRSAAAAARRRRSVAARAEPAPMVAESPRIVAQREAIRDALGEHAPQLGPHRSDVTTRTAPPVVQLGGKYDDVLSKAKNDAEENFDYDYGSVSDEAYVEAADELLAEHLAAGFTGHDTKDVVVPKATPDKKGWGGAPGILYIPERKKGLNLMMGNNTFVPSLVHELGHFALEGKGKNAGMQTQIAKIAERAGPEAERDTHAEAQPKKADWIEECRADLTGVYLRTVRDGAKPPLSDYENQLGGEPADSEHPPGEFRIALIADYLDTL